MKILIIEDDIQLNNVLNEFFTLKAFDVVSVKDGLQALNHIDTENFDLYLIDINLPHINGLDIVKHIRKTDIDTPIIMITASLEIENLTTAFDNGCNEYIKKPFHLKELDIRVKNLLPTSQTNIVTLKDGLAYNLDVEDFSYQSQAIGLRYKEKRFCTILIKNLNTIVSNEAIYDYVWEGEIRQSYPLRQLLVELRKKLPFDIIKTKVKVGYMITSPLSNNH